VFSFQHTPHNTQPLENFNFRHFLLGGAFLSAFSRIISVSKSCTLLATHREVCLYAPSASHNMGDGMDDIYYPLGSVENRHWTDAAWREQMLKTAKEVGEIARNIYVKVSNGTYVETQESTRLDTHELFDKLLEEVDMREHDARFQECHRASYFVHRCLAYTIDTRQGVRDRIIDALLSVIWNKFDTTWQELLAIAPQNAWQRGFPPAESERSDTLFWLSHADDELITGLIAELKSRITSKSTPTEREYVMYVSEPWRRSVDTKLLRTLQSLLLDRSRDSRDGKNYVASNVQMALEQRAGMDTEIVRGIIGPMVSSTVQDTTLPRLSSSTTAQVIRRLNLAQDAMRGNQLSRQGALAEVRQLRQMLLAEAARQTPHGQAPLCRENDAAILLGELCSASTPALSNEAILITLRAVVLLFR
jgi:hypothetical protein